MASTWMRDGDLCWSLFNTKEPLVAGIAIVIGGTVLFVICTEAPRPIRGSDCLSP